MNNDRMTGLVMLCLCLLTWFVLLPRYVEGADQKIFPEAVLVMLMITAGWMIIKPHPDKARAASSPEKTEATRRARVKTGVMALCYLGYLLLIPIIGFFTASLLSTPFFLFFLGVRKPVLLAGVPVGILATIYLVIEWGLRFTMPRGLLM